MNPARATHDRQLGWGGGFDAELGVHGCAKGKGSKEAPFTVSLLLRSAAPSQNKCSCCLWWRGRAACLSQAERVTAVLQEGTARERRPPPPLLPRAVLDAVESELFGSAAMGHRRSQEGNVLRGLLPGLSSTDTLHVMSGAASLFGHRGLGAISLLEKLRHTDAQYCAEKEQQTWTQSPGLGTPSSFPFASWSTHC